MTSPTENASVLYDPDDDGAKTSRSVRAKDKHEDSLLAIDGVVGVGVGSNDSGAEVILVYIRDASVATELPAELEGFAVVPVISGDIHAQ